MKKFVTSPENLAILEALVEALTELKVGEVLPNDRIENLAAGKRHLVAKARAMVEEKTGAVFATIIRHGIKKLEAPAVHTVGEAARGSATRKLKKAHKVIVGHITLNTEGMDENSRRKAIDEIGKLGLAIEFTGK